MDSDASISSSEPLMLRAFHIPGAPRLPLIPASATRRWMDATNFRWPYRCLPLMIANEAGWFVSNDLDFLAKWDGGSEPTSIRFTPLRGEIPHSVESHFGYGILTWKIPYVFRTTSGYNLLVRGPANWPKDGIHALEGIVETDWAVQTFTMNWKITRPNVLIPFQKDEPICMLVPQRRGELEAHYPEIRPLESDPELATGFEQFTTSRASALAEHPWHERQSDDEEIYWQKHYFRGVRPDGTPASTHQTKLNLRGFDDHGCD